MVSLATYGVLETVLLMDITLNIATNLSLLSPNNEDLKGYSSSRLPVWLTTLWLHTCTIESSQRHKGNGDIN